MPVSLAIQAGAKPGTGETKATRIFSAAEAPPAEQRKNHPAANALSFLILDSSSLHLLSPPRFIHSPW
jgi:hypothetical protein